MAKTKAASHPWDNINIGDQVKHPKWGAGTVLFRSAMGEDSKAIVVFPEEGQKKLMLRYAKLEKIGAATKKQLEAMRNAEAEAKPTKAKAKAKAKPKAKTKVVEVGKAKAAAKKK